MLIQFPESSLPITQVLKQEDILSVISDEEIMLKYLGLNSLEDSFVSPFREDKHPTCSLYRNSKGYLYFKDFGNGDHLNCFGVVMKLYNCDYMTALNIIYTDFNLNTVSNKVIRNFVTTVDKKQDKKIQIEPRKFNKEDLNWWGKFGISEKILISYNVFACKTVFLNNEIAFTDEYQKIYGYYGGISNSLERWRIYFPEKKSLRFIGNWDKNLIQGFNQLQYNTNFIVITKSMKDVMCLRGLGIEAVAPNSETSFLPVSIYKKLKSKYKYIIVFYDNDYAGISNMNKIRRDFPELIYIFIPRKYNAKDISDFYSLYGRRKTMRLIYLTKKWLKLKYEKSK